MGNNGKQFKVGVVTDCSSRGRKLVRALRQSESLTASGRLSPLEVEMEALERERIHVLVISTVNHWQDYEVLLSVIRRQRELMALYIGNIALREMDLLMESGITGFVADSPTCIELHHALDMLMRQGFFIPPSWVRRVLHGIQHQARRRAVVRALSKREAAIIEKVCQGLADKEIAVALNISIHTVKQHLKGVYRKFGVRSRAAAAVNWTQARLPLPGLRDAPVGETEAWPPSFEVDL